MKRAVVHIGVHKTGTTSIQEWCYDNRARLRGHGWNYPADLTVQKAHHVLPWSVMDKFERNPISRPHRRPLAELRQHLAGLDDLVLSSEPFCTASDAEVDVIRDLLDGFEVTVVIFVRRQDKLIQSEYVQRVKQEVFPLASSFPDFAAGWRSSTPSMDYAALAERWASRFERVVVRDFDAAARTGLVRGFLAVLGAEDLAPAREEAKNVSLNYHLVAALRELNLLEVMTPGIRRRLSDRLSRHRFPEGRLSFFEGRGASRFIQQFAGSNQRLLDLEGVDAEGPFDERVPFVTADSFVDTRAVRNLEWFNILAGGAAGAGQDAIAPGADPAPDAARADG